MSVEGTDVEDTRRKRSNKNRKLFFGCCLLPILMLLIVPGGYFRWRMDGIPMGKAKHWSKGNTIYLTNTNNFTWENTVVQVSSWTGGGDEGGIRFTGDIKPNETVQFTWQSGDMGPIYVHCDSFPWGPQTFRLGSVYN